VITNSQLADFADSVANDLIKYGKYSPHLIGEKRVLKPQPIHYDEGCCLLDNPTTMSNQVDVLTYKFRNKFAKFLGLNIGYRRFIGLTGYSDNTPQDEVVAQLRAFANFCRTNHD